MCSSFRSIRGKTAIITGAARGLGKGIAETLAEEGVDVVVADILPSVEETFAEILKKNPLNKGFAVTLDVSNEAEVKAMVEKTVSKLGKLDIMVNNAGMHLDETFIWLTQEYQIDKIMAVNFKGVFFGCKYAAIQMMKQKSGTIVNIGSYYGKVGHAKSSVYGASKGAVHTMTQAIAMELAPYRVTVNALCPAWAATDMHWEFIEKDAQEQGITLEELKEMELKRVPLGRYGYGYDYAGAIAWLASESGSYVTGQLINVNGGMDFT
jgi:NAD(P)-dependent dehydrogenase (short-subunit alcohol dehydrogenase family)